jgi:hypothetical protein
MRGEEMKFYTKLKFCLDNSQYFDPLTLWMLRKEKIWYRTKGNPERSNDVTSRAIVYVVNTFYKEAKKKIKEAKNKKRIICIVTPPSFSNLLEDEYRYKPATPRWGKNVNWRLLFKRYPKDWIDKEYKDLDWGDFTSIYNFFKDSKGFSDNYETHRDYIENMSNGENMDPNSGINTFAFAIPFDWLPHFKKYWVFDIKAE